MTREILVGIDGSTESQHAMDWAFDEARRSGRPLHLVHAASDTAYGAALTDNLLHDLLAERGNRIVEQANKLVPPDLSETTEVEWLYDVPSKFLVNASDQAHMVVVGTHGRNLVGAAIRGSVSRHVTRHAKCAVVVVRPMEGKGRVIAGLDLEAPEPLLPTAFQQAAARGLPLTVVRAWNAPGALGLGMGLPTEGLNPVDIERDDRRAAEQLVAQTAGKYPDVAVNVRSVRGDARQVLVDTSKDAELLVVGPHGDGWFFGLTLGSTSAAVAEHAHSPVMVAR
jgi:nucleotide-binding universal stress UspA family protein